MANQAVLAEYYAAREAYDDALENASSGYATEAAEFEAENKRPTLKAFLVGLKSTQPNRPVFLDARNYPGCEVSDVEYMGCSDGWHEWQSRFYVPRRRAKYRAVVRLYPDDSWTVNVSHALTRRDVLVTGREWDAQLHHWADACLQECKYGN
jgi:hypothetical protein